MKHVRVMLSIFIPNPFAFICDLPIKPDRKWEDTPKAERKTDGYSIFLAHRFISDE